MTVYTWYRIRNINTNETLYVGDNFGRACDRLKFNNGIFGGNKSDYVIEELNSNNEVVHSWSWADMAKKFEQGRLYNVNGGGVIRITKRTPCYATFEVVSQPELECREMVSSGRKMVGYGILDSECFWIENSKCQSSMLVTADGLVEDDEDGE